MTDFKDLIDEEQIIKWRRHFHENPELSFKEYETSKYIREVLESYEELEVSQLTETSVVALLKGGKPGKTIGLRADIDALPVTEETGVDFVSNNPGVMHACGHDTHAAMLLGAVDTLVQLKDDLAGNVKFIFQHAEEVPPGGAKELVEKGVMDDIDMIFGLHIAPYIPIGVVATGVGSLSASSDVVELKIKGKGSHGSTPEQSIDPITIGAEIVNNINNIVSRNISALDPTVISFGQFSAGEIANVIPDTATIKATVRTVKQDTRMYVKERIETIVKNVCDMYGAEYELDYLLGYSSIVNDKEAVDYVLAAAEKIGTNTFVGNQPMMGSEDFSAYTEVKPGAFFALGGGTPEDGVNFSNHHPKFNISEKALPYGTAMHVQLVLDTIGK